MPPFLPPPSPCSNRWRELRLLPLALLLLVALPGARGGLTATMCGHAQIICDCEEDSPPSNCSDSSVILRGTGTLSN